jgi:hypothetical protein
MQAAPCLPTPESPEPAVNETPPTTPPEPTDSIGREGLQWVVPPGWVVYGWHPGAPVPDLARPWQPPSPAPPGPAPAPAPAQTPAPMPAAAPTIAPPMMAGPPSPPMWWPPALGPALTPAERAAQLGIPWPPK